jgi:mannose-1-phosphate guanylyltransferase/mannose-6-phosphate isomerase
MQKTNCERHALHRKVHDSWGWHDSIDEEVRSKVKCIHVKFKVRLSLQMHFHRAERWLVVTGAGAAEITNGDKMIILTENQSIRMPLDEVCRLANPCTIPPENIELQSGSSPSEDDIARLEAHYGHTK